MDELKSVRLEVLRLVHRHDLPPEAVVARARDLEAYVTNADNRSATPRPADSGKDRKPGPGR